jgi:hypothetical protein
LVINRTLRAKALTTRSLEKNEESEGIWRKKNQETVASTRSNEAKKPVSMKKRKDQAVIMEGGSESIAKTGDIMFTEEGPHSNTFVPRSPSITPLQEFNDQDSLSKIRIDPKSTAMFPPITNDSGSVDRGPQKTSTTSEFLESMPDGGPGRDSQTKTSSSVYRGLTGRTGNSESNLELNDIAELDEEILKIDEEIKKIKRD